VGLDFVTTIDFLITIVSLTTIGSLTTDSLTTIGSFFIIKTVSFSVLISFRLAARGGTPGIPLTPLTTLTTLTTLTPPTMGTPTILPTLAGGHTFDYQYWTDLAVSVQSELAQRGYYQGAIDGVIGSDSREAIRAFQAAQGLPVTGAIDTKLLNALGIKYKTG
jgi:hypothetical protein